MDREAPMRTLKIAVIADDMTGAADTGIQFLPSLAPGYLIDHRFLKSARFPDPPMALSVYTNTRALPASRAKRVLSEAAQGVRDRRPARVYKKIDSTLRGNIGAEVEVLLEVLGLGVSFIAPAFPEQGRTTLSGTHLVHGRPVAETEAARDPLTPVTGSCLPEWVGRQTRLKVGHIGADFLEGGAERTAKEIDRLRNLGVSHYTFDAIKQAHLDRIVTLASHWYPESLLCGSAGLAQSLAASFAGKEKDRSPSEDFSLKHGPLLLVCGSASKTLQGQVDELVKTSGCAREILPPRLLADPDGRALWEAPLRRTASALSRHGLTLQIGPREKETPPLDPESLVRGLARFVGLLIKRVRPGGLFLSGGDTASAVLDMLKAHPVRLVRQLSGGLVQGVAMEGPMAGRLLVTKAGAFGKPEALSNLYHLLFQGKANANENRS